MVERLKHGKMVVSSSVVLLGTVAFSCCVAAEFKKTKAKDMELDGSLCSLPRSSAFGLGIAAIVCLFLAQIVGTSMAGAGLCSRGKYSGSCSRIVSTTLLALSWVSFGLTAILLGTGSSMNSGQAYGKGWLDGECYVVKKGVYAGAAVLTVATVILILGFFFSTRTTLHPRTGPDEETTTDQQHK